MYGCTIGIFRKTETFQTTQFVHFWQFIHVFCMFFYYRLLSFFQKLVRLIVIVNLQTDSDRQSKLSFISAQKKTFSIGISQSWPNHLTRMYHLRMRLIHSNESYLRDNHTPRYRIKEYGSNMSPGSSFHVGTAFSDRA